MDLRCNECGLRYDLDRGHPAAECLGEQIATLESRNAALVVQLARYGAAATWVLHNAHGISKGGEEYGPPSDAERREAYDSLQAALSACPEHGGRR